MRRYCLIIGMILSILSAIGSLIAGCVTLSQGDFWSFLLLTFVLCPYCLAQCVVFEFVHERLPGKAPAPPRATSDTAGTPWANNPGHVRGAPEQDGTP